MVKGDRGVFDVTVDGKLIFSRHSEERFPENSEIVELLRDRMG